MKSLVVFKHQQIPTFRYIQQQLQEIVPNKLDSVSMQTAEVLTWLKNKELWDCSGSISTIRTQK